jgi:hypothetical protein
MPLFCNGELFNEDHKRFEEITAKIAEFDHPFMIKSRTGQVNSDNNLPFRLPNYNMPLESNVIVNGRGETWRYNEYVPTIKEGGYDWIGISRSKMIQNGQLVINCPKEAELAYFITNLSPNLMKDFYVFNPEGEASERIQNQQMEMEVQRACISKMKSNPLSNIVKLRNTAAAWGIAGADKIAEDMLRERLLSQVKDSQRNYAQTNRGYKEFIEELETEDLILEYRSYIQKGFDNKVNQKDRSYYWVDQNSGVLASNFFTVPALLENQKAKLLLDYFRNDFKAYEQLKEAMESSKQTSRYSNLDIGELRKMAKAVDINTYQKSKAEIEKSLIAHDNQLQS